MTTTRRPQWTEALLQRKRLKKAGGRPLDSIPTQERERLERRALASAFAVIIQGHEDECLMTAVRVLQGGGWIVHSLQQDGVLAEPGRLAGGGFETVQSDVLDIDHGGQYMRTC